MAGKGTGGTGSPFPPVSASEDPSHYPGQAEESPAERIHAKIDDSTRADATCSRSSTVWPPLRGTRSGDQPEDLAIRLGVITPCAAGPIVTESP